MPLAHARPLLFLLLAPVSLLGCGGGNGNPGPDVVEEGFGETTIRFEARVGDRAFQCGETYTGVGTSGTTFKPMDFRFYVHDVRLLTADGAEHPLSLVQDGAFQGDRVALLDFEDKSGECSNGTAETHTALTGRVAASGFTGIRFNVGVPEDLNHGDASTAAAPLNFSTLFWSWQGGYKFLRIDGKSTGQPTGLDVHLGSTGCAGQPVTCTQPNQFEVTLTGFDPTAGKVVADLGALFAGSDLDANAPGSPPGCMSSQTDADCQPIFERLGLPFADHPAAQQSFFRAE